MGAMGEEEKERGILMQNNPNKPKYAKAEVTYWLCS